MAPEALVSWFHAVTSCPPRASGRPRPAEARDAGTAADAAELSLPRPASPDRALAVSIAGRASWRVFAGPLQLPDVSTLLHWAYGTTGAATVGGFRFATRPVPSAGATYPLGVHLVAWAVDGIPPGTYRYSPARHVLVSRGAGPSRSSAAELFLGQRHLAAAAALVVVTAAFDATLARYGARGYRYVLLEAGHLAQNLNLVSSALGLAGLDLGGFLDRELAESLGLADEVPLYGVALGRPPATARKPLRDPGDGTPP
jgi:SagB-type dehydrogenase family enzyme